MKPDFRHYLRQMKTLPPREVIRRSLPLILKIAADSKRKISNYLFGTMISDQDFFIKAWSKSNSFLDGQQLVRHFTQRERPKSFISTTFPSFSDLFPFMHRETVSSADKSCHHIFDLLGSGDVDLGATIDWHCDFKAGYCWDPRTYYKEIKIPYGKADIKVPWELSRFYHAATLGQAYSLTNDEKYAKEFVIQVNNWIDANKPKFGVNWTCTMDVAIRACNWIVGYYFFRNSSALTDEFSLKFLKSLYQHGKHIRSNLEYSETLTSNHYLSNIAGLVYLGVLFPEFKEAQEWRDFGIKELVREMEKQVYADGCDFEASTCYHRLMLELFFFPMLVAVINDPGFTGNNHREVSRKIFGERFTEKLFLMFEAILYLLKPDGRMPQFGDNDSGRLHIFHKRDGLDMRYLLTLGAIFFQEEKFKVDEFGFCEEALWIFGNKGQTAWQQLKESRLTDVKSHAFPDTGWYIMRNNRDYLAVSCGPNGQKDNGGHAHNDKLSFELALNGIDFIIDPGTYVYTPEPQWRNTFRSTAFHNTVTVDGEEQNRFEDWTVFSLRNDAHAKCVQWECTKDHDRFVGEHYGYERLKEPLVHRRDLLFDKRNGALRIADSFRGEGRHRCEWHFHFSFGLSLEQDESGAILARTGGGEGIVLSPLTANDSMEVAILEGWISPEYGTKRKTVIARYTAIARAGVDMIFEVKKIG